MTGPNSNQTLERLWDEVPVGAAPVDDIIRGARTARRRKRTAGLLGGLAAVLVAGVVTQQVISPDGGDGDSTLVASATPIDLPTSSWKSGDFAFQAAATGVIAVDDRGCVYLTPPGAQRDLPGLTQVESGDGLPRSYWVWPAGYTASVTDDGRLTIFDASGSVVARDGDQVEVGGASGIVTAKRAHRCLPEPGTDEVFSVQSGVTVVP